MKNEDWVPRLRACKIAGVTPMTMYRWMDSGKVTWKGEYGERMVDRASLSNHLKAQRKRKRMSYKAIGDRLGISREAARKYARDHGRAALVRRLRHKA